MIIYDDIPQAFYPICLSRPVSDLRCGILKLRQRLTALFKDDDAALWIEPRLEKLWQERLPDWPLNRPAKKGRTADQLTHQAQSRCYPSHQGPPAGPVYL
jgi:hypothetical protein